MSSIDERVVEMQFDNDQFESGIKQSTDSLDKFKESLDLDGAAKGLDDVSDTISKFTMDGVTTAVETASNSFSALETVATAALVNITSQAVQAGEQMLASLSIDQVSAGYDKYTQKISNVQTIMNATGKTVDEVNEYLDHLMWYSDETSYKFADMTNAIATMTSTGGDIETLIPMIEGVANATAYAGQDAEAFTHVMYFLNNAYSRGYVSANDWTKGIQQQKVGSEALQEVLIQTAEELGKIDEGTITLENFRDTLTSDKWLDTEVMEAGFGKFAEMTEAAYEAIENGEFETATEAYAALADEFDEITVAASNSAQQAKTFQEVIDATKEAVSSRWTEIFQSIIGDYDQSVELWSNLCETLYDVFVTPFEKLGDVIAEGFGTGSTTTALEGFSGDWNDISDQIRDAGLSVGEFQNALIQVFGSDAGLMAILDDCGSIEQAFNSLDSSTRMSVISQAIDMLAGSSDSAVTSVSELGDVVNEVIRGDFGNGEERIQALTEAGYDYEEVQALVNQRILEGRTDWEELSDEELLNLGYTQEAIDEWREFGDSIGATGDAATDALLGWNYFWDGLGNIGNSILQIGDAISEAWGKVFDPLTGEGLFSALQNFYEFTQTLELSEDTIEKISDALSGLFSVFKLIGNVISTVVTKAFNLLSPILSKVGGIILDVASNVGKAVTAFAKWVDESGIIGKAFDKIVGVLKTVKDGIVSFGESILELPQVQSVITTVTNVFNGALNKLKAAFPKTTKAIEDFIAKFDGLENLDFDAIVEIFKDIGSEIQENLAQVFPKTIESVNNFIEKFQEGFENLKLEDITEIFSNLWDELKQGIKDFVDDSTTLTSIKNAIKGMFASIEESTGIDFSGIIQSFTDLKDKICGVIDDILRKFGLLDEEGDEGTTTTISKSVEAMDQGVQEIHDVLVTLDEDTDENTGILATIGDAISWFFEKLGSINWGGVIAFAAAIGIFVAAFNTIRSAVNVTSAITDITTSLKSLTSSLKGDSWSAMIKSIALAIGILAAALVVLSQIPAVDLWKAVGVIGGLAAIIIVLSGALGALNKFGFGSTGSSAGSSVSLLAMAAAILILVQAFQQIDNMELSWSTLGSIAILIAIIGALTTAVTLMNKFSSVGSAGRGLGSALEMIAFAAAIKLLISALDDCMKMQDNFSWSGLLAMIGVMGTMILAISALSKLAGGASIGTAATLLALPIALKLFLSAMDDIADYDTDKLLDSIGNFIIIMGEMAALALVSRLSGSGGGATMLAMAASLIIIAEAMKMLGNLDESSMNQATGAIAVIMTCLTAMVGVMEVINTISTIFGGAGATKMGSMAASIVALAAGVGVMAIAVAGLAQLDPQAMNNALDAVISLSAIMSVMMVASKFTGKATSILSMAAMIIAIAGALALLTVVDTTALDSAATAMTELGLVFSVMGVVSNFVDIGGMATIVVAIAAVAAIIGALSYFTDADDLSATCSALAEVLPVMNQFIAVLTICSLVAGLGSVASLAGMIEIVAVIGVIALIIGALSAFTDAGDLTATCAALALVLPVISMLIEVLGECALAVGIGVAGIGVGLAAIAAAIPALAAVIVAVGALTHVDGFQDFINGAFSSIGEAIGNFIGSMKVAATGTELKGLQELSEELGPAMDGIQEFAEQAGAIDDSAFGNMDSIIDTILKLTEAKVLEGITSFIGGTSDFSSFGESLSALADGISEYVEKAGNIDQSAFASANESIESLITLEEKLPKVGGIIGFFTGEYDWASLYTGLAEMGQGLADFSASVSGETYDNAAVSAAIECLETLATAQGKIEASGGVLQDLVGTSDWATLGSGLKEMGQALSDFSGSITGEGAIDETAMTAAINCLTPLAEAEGKIENTGGIIQDLTGTSDWATLGTGLAEMGKALSSFSESVSGLGDNDVTNINTAIEAIKALAEAQGKIENAGGVLQKLFGDSDWSTLSDGLSELGTALANFSSNIGSEGTFDADSVESGVEAIQKLTELNGTVLVDTSGLNWMKDNLGDLGQSLADFNGSIAGLTWPDDLGELASIIEAIGSASDSVSGMKKGGQLGKVLDEVGPSLADFCKKMNNVEIPDMTSVAEMVDAIGDASKSVKGMDTSQLSTILSNVGTELSNFVTEMQGVTIPDLSDLVSMMKAIGSASESVAGMKTTQLSEIVGNVKESLEGFGDITMPDNASEISEMIESIGTACSSAEGVSTDDLSTMLTTISTTLTSFDGITIPDIVTDLAGFVESFTSITWPTDMSDMENCFESIKKVCTDFDGVTIPTADSLSGFSSGLSSELSSAGEDGAKALVEGLNSSSGDMTSAGESLIEATSEGISGAESSLTSSVDTVVLAGIDTALGYQSNYQASGVSLITAMSIGMRNTSGSVSSAVAYVCQAGVTASSGYANSFRASGIQMMQGLANGIREGGAAAVSATRSIVSEINSLIDNMEKIGSPSKVMYQKGGFMMMGLANGITVLGRSVVAATKDVMKSTDEVVSTGLQEAEDLLNGDMSYSPVITPVLDLSQVEAGAASMNGMFLNTPTMRVNTDQVTGAFGAMSNYQQGTKNPNADLLSAIKGLDERLGSVRGNTYNVNGVTYDDGTNVADAIGQLMHAAKIERRV